MTDEEQQIASAALNASPQDFQAAALQAIISSPSGLKARPFLAFQRVLTANNHSSLLLLSATSPAHAATHTQVLVDALIEASINCRPDVVAALLAAAGSIDTATRGPPDFWDEAVSSALRRDDAALLSLLLDRTGFRFGGGDAGGLIPAAGAGAVACMEVLAHRGIDPVTAAASDGNTPLIAACERRQPRSVAWLLERGAPVNARRGGGGSAATTAVIALLSYERPSLWGPWTAPPLPDHC